jgi:hypothetical protein
MKPMNVETAKWRRDAFEEVKVDETVVVVKRRRRRNLIIARLRPWCCWLLPFSCSAAAVSRPRHRRLAQRKAAAAAPFPT